MKKRINITINEGVIALLDQYGIENRSALIEEAVIYYITNKLTKTSPSKNPNSPTVSPKRKAEPLTPKPKSPTASTKRKAEPLPKRKPPLKREEEKEKKVGEKSEILKKFSQFL